MIATVEIVMAIAMVVTVPLTNCTPNQILYPRGCSLPNRVYGSKILKKIPRIYWIFFSDFSDFFRFVVGYFGFFRIFNFRHLKMISLKIQLPLK